MVFVVVHVSVGRFVGPLEEAALVVARFGAAVELAALIGAGFLHRQQLGWFVARAQRCPAVTIHRRRRRR